MSGEDRKRQQSRACYGCGKLFGVEEGDVMTIICPDCKARERELNTPREERGADFICAANDCEHNEYPQCAVSGRSFPILIAEGGKCAKFSARQHTNSQSTAD